MSGDVSARWPAWRTVRLGDHATFLRTDNSPRAALTEEGDLKYLHYGDIHANESGRVDFAHDDMPAIETHRVGSADRLQPGDLVFVDASEDLEGVGKSVEVTDSLAGQAVAGLHTIAVRFDKRVLVDGFKAYLQHVPEFRQRLVRLAAGTSVYATQKSHIADLEVRIPSASEQRAIAEVLRDVDQLVESLERVIAKKQDVLTAARQALLSRGQRLASFTTEWRERALGEVCDVVPGGTPNTDVDAYWNGGIPWCTPTDITAGHGRYLQATGRTITEKGLGASSARLLPENALLLCTRATIGELRLASQPVATNQGFKSIVCGSAVDPTFLYFQLIERRQDIEALGSGSTFDEVGTSDLRAMKLLLPEIDEQRAIAEALADMDDEITSLRRRLTKTRQVKRGMMQELLTGRTRRPAEGAAA